MATTSKKTAAVEPGQWLDDMKKMMEKNPLPGVDLEALIDWQRRDLEALSEANRQAADGIQSLVAKRNEILQETLAQWQAAVQQATGKDAIGKQAEAAKQGVQQAIANFRELAEIEAQARSSAWKSVQDRMQENLGSLQKLLQPK